MKIAFIFFTILFFTSTNLLASTTLFCKTDWSINQYPYKYITIEINPHKYVYIHDSAYYPRHYYDSDKYTKEDIKDFNSSEIKTITWDNNYINVDDFEIDLINLMLKKTVRGSNFNDIVFLCEKTKRKF